MEKVKRAKRMTIDEKLDIVRNRAREIEKEIKEIETYDENDVYGKLDGLKEELKALDRAYRYANFYMTLPIVKKQKAHQVLNKVLR